MPHVRVGSDKFRDAPNFRGVISRVTPCSSRYETLTSSGRKAFSKKGEWVVAGGRNRSAAARRLPCFRAFAPPIVLGRVSGAPLGDHHSSAFLFQMGYFCKRFVPVSFLDSETRAAHQSESAPEIPRQTSPPHAIHVKHARSGKGAVWKS